MNEPWRLVVPITGAEPGRAELPSLDHVTAKMREALEIAARAHAEAEAAEAAEHACGFGSGPERKTFEDRTRQAREVASVAFVRAQEVANEEGEVWAQLLARRYSHAVSRFNEARAELAAAAQEAVSCAQLRRTASQAPYRLAVRHGERVGAAVLLLATEPLRDVSAPGIDA